MKNHHPNENPTPAPWMRRVMENKGGLSPHHFGFLCYKREPILELILLKIRIKKDNQNKNINLHFYQILGR